MHNNWNAFLKNATRIARVSNGQFLVVVNHDEVGSSVTCGKRTLFNRALHPDAAVRFTAFSNPNFIDIAVVVDSGCEEPTDNHTAADHDQHQDGNITPLGISLARRERCVVGRSSRS